MQGAGKNVALSIHDNLLISYEVQCEGRTILLRTEYRLASKPSEFTNVAFKGVHGYHFQNDAFGNIIFGLETLPVEQFLTEFKPEIYESYRMAGSPDLGREISTPPQTTFVNMACKRSFCLRLMACLAGFSHKRFRYSQSNRTPRSHYPTTAIRSGVPPFFFH